MDKARKPSILVVEDDSAYRQLLMLALETAGYGTRGAENGKVAMLALRTFRPDLILLDLMMPVMDGLRFLEESRRESRLDMPVIVLTCMDARHIAVDALVAGASEVLTKPVSMDVLMERIASHQPQVAAEVRQ
jgi:DNA-binding response OmpR family regulator